MQAAATRCQEQDARQHPAPIPVPHPLPKLLLLPLLLFLFLIALSYVSTCLSWWQEFRAGKLCQAQIPARLGEEQREEKKTPYTSSTPEAVPGAGHFWPYSPATHLATPRTPCVLSLQLEGHQSSIRPKQRSKELLWVWWWKSHSRMKEAKSRWANYSMHERVCSHIGVCIFNTSLSFHQFQIRKHPKDGDSMLNLLLSTTINSFSRLFKTQLYQVSTRKRMKIVQILICCIIVCSTKSVAVPTTIPFFLKTHWSHIATLLSAKDGTPSATSF